MILNKLTLSSQLKITVSHTAVKHVIVQKNYVHYVRITPKEVTIITIIMTISDTCSGLLVQDRNPVLCQRPVRQKRTK